MKFDRNTILGFVILAVLFFAYFWYNNKEMAAVNKKKAAEQARQQEITDSLNLVNKPKQDSLAHIQDSISKLAAQGSFAATGDSTERSFVLENTVVRVTFTNKGGQVKKVELKNYKGPDSALVRLGASRFDNFSYTINTGNQRTAETGSILFSEVDTSAMAAGRISFTQKDSMGQSITHEYTLRPNDYMIDGLVKLQGANQLLTNGVMNLSWGYAAVRQESDLSYERQNTQVGYVEDGSFDYHTIHKKSSRDFSEPVNWIGVRQRFFMAALIAKNNFSSGSKWTWSDDTTGVVAVSRADMKLNVTAGSPSVIPLSFYYGPSDYHILKSYGLKFEKLVNLGQGVYAFVRPLNRYVILPMFDIFKSVAGSMGLAIFLLTLFIRLLISPITYSSYLSSAKMKALRPELNALREKVGDDRQAMSMEQMKLFREAGVNPLGGCIPALLQIPIFFSLFSFFNSAIDLRDQDFLWSTDLSAPDMIIHFGTNIPLLGNHLSLFNVAATFTSFLISWYSMSMAPDQNNPVMKYMPYIFPVFLLFFFNNLPSGLTWYYTCSNLITLVLQFIIQNYIINHDKILAKIEANRKKPKVKSKWQERMEQVQEQQKKMKEMQQRRK